MKIVIDKKTIIEEMGTFPGSGILTKAKDTVVNGDINSLRDKLVNNAGLVTGGLLAGGGMMSHMLNDGNDVGASLIGGAVLGAAGAGTGHVIHNQIKKNNQNNQNFDNFKY